jgi:hypothetical protein
VSNVVTRKAGLVYGKSYIPTFAPLLWSSFHFGRNLSTTPGWERGIYTELP